MLTTVAAARQLLAATHLTPDTETVPFADCGGRILARPVTADRDQPPFDRVAMDGIAIDYTAYAAGRRRFVVERLQPAGAAPEPLQIPTNCVEIMTGAALPPGVTTVIRYEDLERDGNAFVVPEGIEDGKSIHRRGKDITAGTELAPARRRIGPAEIGMLASCGYTEVSVLRQLRVAVVATGNELVAVDQQPLDHQIRLSNVFQLAHLLERNGCVTTLHHFPDEQKTLRDRLADCLAASDLVVLSGGVSKGKLDFVPGVLTELGVDKLFHGVAQRPGKPLFCGRWGRTMVFGLPGNPVSSLNCLIAYVLPWVRRCYGLPEPMVTARLTEDLTFRPDLTLFQLVGLRSDPDTAELFATPVRNQGSGDATSLLRADGFLELPRGREVYRAGEVFGVRRM